MDVRTPRGTSRRMRWWRRTKRHGSRYWKQEAGRLEGGREEGSIRKKKKKTRKKKRKKQKKRKMNVTEEKRKRNETIGIFAIVEMMIDTSRRRTTIKIGAFCVIK